EEEESQSIKSPEDQDHAYTFESEDPLNPLDTKRIQTIRDVISAIMVQCKYKEEWKKKLKSAVYSKKYFSVCIGDSTILAASDKYNVPRSTLHSLVQNARLSLGRILPPQVDFDVVQIFKRTTIKNLIQQRI
ncbi:hypothetical protein PENTCL1PPCAC_23623, partial [Pristionchus entomophagus]